MNKFKNVVYKVTNIENGKCYIGITSKSMKVRRAEHYNKATKSNLNYPFINALRKYSKDSFIWEEVCFCSDFEYAKIMEIKFIEIYNTFYKNGGYNSTLGGDGMLGHPGPFRGQKRDPVTIKKISESKKRSLKLLGHPMTGKKMSRDHIEKLRIINTGRSPINKGLPMSKEQKIKCSAGCKSKKSLVVIDLTSGMPMFFESVKQAAAELKTERSFIYQCMNKRKNSRKYLFLYEEKA